MGSSSQTTRDSPTGSNATGKLQRRPSLVQRIKSWTGLASDSQVMVKNGEEDIDQIAEQFASIQTDDSSSAQVEGKDLPTQQTTQQAPPPPPAAADESTCPPQAGAVTRQIARPPPLDIDLMAQEAALRDPEPLPVALEPAPVHADVDVRRYQRLNSRGGDGEDTTGLSCVLRHNVRVVGSGSHVLVMSHGFGTNQQVWGGVLQHFDMKEYRIVLYDLMGAYSTDPENFSFHRYSSLHGYADDLLELLDELGIRRCTYIGHSVSGMIGTIASVERPEVFDRLILIGASPRYLDEPHSGYTGGFSLEMLDQVFAAMQDNYKVWASGFAPMVVGEDVESVHVREFCRTLFLIRPDISFSTLKTIFTCDLRHLLPQVSVQVHLLQTAVDAAVPFETMQYMVDHFPNVRFEILDMEGHLPHLTHPHVVAGAVMRHLALPLEPSKNLF